MPHVSTKDDDGVIDLRNESKSSDEAEFRINRSENDTVQNSAVTVLASAAAGENSSMGVQSVPVSEMEALAMKPYDKVKVKFDKFVNLVATHAYEEVFEKHLDDDVIISTDLLADLANAHEEKPNKKTPLFFVIGILIGVGVAWILLRN